MTIRRLLFSFVVLLLAAFAISAPSLEVTAQGAIIMDAQSGKVLWSKDPTTPRYPASTTKIMTALLLIEHCLPSDIIVAPPGVDKVEGASLHLVPGEQMTAQEMLYGLLLRSANDGCVAVAVHISGSVPAFVQLMNERARQIGCKSTHFDNPNGLNDPKHTISPYDLALIAREAMKYPAFRSVVSIRKHEIDRSINVQDRFLVSKNKYLSIDPTADGIKTGWTREAGQCYVGSATRNGYRIITVILHASNWKHDNATMFDWAFQNHDRKLIVKAGDPIAEVKVANGTDDRIPATVREDLYQVFDRAHPCEVSEKVALDPQIPAPVAKGQQVGTLELSDADGWTERVPLIASDPVPRAASIVGGFGRTGMWLMAGLACSGAYILKRRYRRFLYAKSYRRRV